MSDSNAPEPTMEEILASIRRIISEDEPAAEAAPAPAAAAPAHEPEPEPEPAAVHVEPEPEEDVLELTQVAEPEPEPEPAPVETHGDIEIHAAAPEPAPEPAPPSPVAAPAPLPVARRDEEPLMSETPASAASSAFGHLAQTVTMPAEGRVLEDVVRELLRPLLTAWLDEHLPSIVQAKVDEEVARIARRR